MYRAVSSKNSSYEILGHKKQLKWNEILFFFLLKNFDFAECEMKWQALWWLKSIFCFNTLNIMLHLL